MRVRTAFVFLFPFFFGFYSCFFDNEDPAKQECVFIEQHANTDGVLISGPEPPLLMVDFPTYSYDEETKTLTGLIDFEISKDLKLIFGSGGCLSGTAGGGCGTGLSAVYEIPYKRNSFEILKLEENGDLVFIYNDEVYSLSPGQEWKTETTRTDTIDVEGVPSINLITETDRITHYGFIKKEDIVIWEW